MLRSMTGFASKTIVLSSGNESKIQITISIKSLNARFFETTFKMPHMVSNLEVPLIKQLKKQLFRGHLYFTLHISDTSIFKGEVEPVIPVCTGYAHAIEKIKKHISLSGSLTVADLISIPQAFTVQEKELDEKTKTMLFQTIDDVMQILIQEQEKEGATLQDDILERITHMKKDITIIAQRSTKQVADYKEKIAQTTPQSDEADPAADVRKTALYLTLDKIDIHEEIVRFKSHLENLQALISATSIEKGKRIDFTLQELSREINTIAAKASDTQISSLAINIKVELEKAREQTQNIV